MKSIRHNLRAFTLAEVMIAVAILGIGLVMVASIFPVAANYTRQAATENLSRMTYENAKQQITAHMNATGNAGFLSQVSQAAAAHFIVDNKGIWNSGTTYAVGDYVWDHDRSTPKNIWRCIQANSQREPAPSGFVTGQTYTVGECVSSSSIAYYANANTNVAPPSSAWTSYTPADFWTQGGTVGAKVYNKVWSVTSTYNVGDVVVRRGGIYECKNNGITGAANDPNPTTFVPTSSDKFQPTSANWSRWDWSGTYVQPDERACRWFLVSMPNHPFGLDAGSGLQAIHQINAVNYSNWPRAWVQSNTYKGGGAQAFSNASHADCFTVVDSWKYCLQTTNYSVNPFDDAFAGTGNWRAMYWPAPLFSTHTPADNEINSVPGSPERAYSFGSSTPYPSKDASEAMYTWDALIYTGQSTTGSTVFKVFVIVYSKPRVDETYTCTVDGTKVIGALDWMRYSSTNANKNKLPWLVYGNYNAGSLNTQQEIENAVPPVGYVGYTVTTGKMFTQGMKSDGTAGQAFPEPIDANTPVIYVLPSDASNANPVSFAAPPFTIDSGE